ncbi:hypothetical protein [Robertmurraya kyonggiensis]|nr:hypothetical protein [Robertmurraya kyonggiensis]
MKDQVISITKEWPKGGDGYKVVRVEVSDPSENLYAVCTPIKKQ